jgi:hypothetical protein
MRKSISERFWAKVRKTDGCWLWTAARSSTGYGVFAIAKSGCSAHRVIYELLHGPVPADMEIDHLCGQRLCVNPAHLEAVSRSINKRRSRNRDETKCKRGHPRATGGSCKTCRDAFARAFYYQKTIEWALANPTPTPSQRRERLVAALRMLAAKLGHTPALKEINRSGYAHNTFVKYFGSISGAQIAAGLTPNKVGHRAMALAS